MQFKIVTWFWDNAFANNKIHKQCKKIKIMIRRRQKRGYSNIAGSDKTMKTHSNQRNTKQNTSKMSLKTKCSHFGIVYLLRSTEYYRTNIHIVLCQYISLRTVPLRAKCWLFLPSVYIAFVNVFIKTNYVRLYFNSWNAECLSFAEWIRWELILFSVKNFPLCIIEIENETISKVNIEETLTYNKIENTTLAPEFKTVLTAYS